MQASADGPYVIGVDLGGTKILAGVVDAAHRIVGRSKRPTPVGQGESVLLSALVGGVQEAMMRAMVRAEEIAGVGIGAPGTLDADEGVVRIAPNLQVRDFGLGPALAAELGLPVLLRNDVRSGGYGEFRLGSGRGYRDILAVFVGTGIGGCVIQGGELRTGPTGNAGEIGHVIAKLGGPRCGCGRKGCLEAMASRTAIAGRVRRAVRRGESTSLKSAMTGSGGERLKSKELAAAVAAGDRVAVREVERAARVLGLTLGGLINLMAPEIVILGGGVTEALGDPWVDRVRHWARRQAMADPAQSVVLARAALGDDAGVLGAGLMARERFAPGSASDTGLGSVARDLGITESNGPL